MVHWLCVKWLFTPDTVSLYFIDAVQGEHICLGMPYVLMKIVSLLCENNYKIAVEYYVFLFDSYLSKMLSMVNILACALFIPDYNYVVNLYKFISILHNN